MRYKMYDEMMEQPEAIRKTFDAELDNMAEVQFLLVILFVMH